MESKEQSLSDFIENEWEGYEGNIATIKVKEAVRKLKHQLHLWEIDEEEIDKVLYKIFGPKLTK